jgi:dinuclear metal center YbgI/SA1388 family protein
MTLRLDQLILLLETIAPPELAEPWDNVGLLIEPPLPSAGLTVGQFAPSAAAVNDIVGERLIERVLLTIDLTEAVAAEAAALGVELIVAYHPPIFSGLKRLGHARVTERLVLGLVVNGVAVYSPHTALDAANGGVNDWLASGLGSGVVEAVGIGRATRLMQPVPITTIVPRLKHHLGIGLIRAAMSERHARGEPIEQIAVCAGSGSSIFENWRGPELFVTGELRHHAILEKLGEGASVLVCDHTNTERGYLPVFRERLLSLCSGEIEVLVSKVDRDPLQII